jgi:hypothetical protein
MAINSRQWTVLHCLLIFKWINMNISIDRTIKMLCPYSPSCCHPCPYLWHLPEQVLTAAKVPFEAWEVDVCWRGVVVKSEGLPCFARLWQTIEMNDKSIKYSTIEFLSPFLYNNELEQWIEGFSLDRCSLCCHPLCLVSKFGLLLSWVQTDHNMLCILIIEIQWHVIKKKIRSVATESVVSSHCHINSPCTTCGSQWAAWRTAFVFPRTL